jgi:hypothetical protein
MNAQELAALGTMFREAIEKHVSAAMGTVRGQLAQRDQEIETLRGQIKTLLNPEVQDDTFYDDIWWKIEDRVKGLIPAPYDDSVLRESIPKAYDDTQLQERVKKMEANLGGDIVPNVATQLNSVPAAYDDSALRENLSKTINALEVTAQNVAELAKSVSALEARPEPAAPRDGVDGRDALQLEILPAIDEQKSYTRGTYAKHAGGLWRSFEQTSGMRGWECIVNGVKSVDTRWEGKTLIETTTLSDGTTHETRKSFAVQEYKGVFAHGDHEEGDTVTWAGSLWHCNVTGTKALPGDGSSDWTLAVKKGRDGREVVKTERAQGPVKIGGA